MECIAVPSVLDEIDIGVENGLPPLNEIEEDMALSQADKEWILNASNKHTGFLGFIKEYGAMVAILLFVLTQWNRYIEFRTTTKDKLDTISDRLDKIDGRLAKQAVVSQSSLPLAEFKATLPDLSDALATVSQQKIAIPSNVVSDLRQKVATTDAQAPGYWPVAAELVSYHSQDALVRPNLPNCTDHEPVPMQVNATKTGIHNAYYENCRFTLDSASDDAKVNDILIEEAFALDFRHCLIVYRGGDINLLIAVTNEVSTTLSLDGKKVSGPVSFSGS